MQATAASARGRPTDPPPSPLGLAVTGPPLPRVRNRPRPFARPLCPGISDGKRCHEPGGGDLNPRPVPGTRRMPQTLTGKAAASAPGIGGKRRKLPGRLGALAALAAWSRGSMKVSLGFAGLLALHHPPLNTMGKPAPR